MLKDMQSRWGARCAVDHAVLCCLCAEPGFSFVLVLARGRQSNQGCEDSTHDAEDATFLGPMGNLLRWY